MDTSCLSQLILDRYHCSCAVSAVWIYLATCIYKFSHYYHYYYNFSTYYVYNGFYVFDFIAYCWATCSALRALLSSYIMRNKHDDDDDDDDVRIFDMQFYKFMSSRYRVNYFINNLP